MFGLITTGALKGLPECDAYSSLMIASITLSHRCVNSDRRCSTGNACGCLLTPGVSGGGGGVLTTVVEALREHSSKSSLPVEVGEKRCLVSEVEGVVEKPVAKR